MTILFMTLVFTCETKWRLGTCNIKRGSPSQNLGIAKHPCTRTVTHKMEVTASRAIKLAILG